MKRLLSLRVACFLVAAGPCLASEQSPIFDRLGRHYFKITTRLPAAQRSFDRGITLVYGYERVRGEKGFLATTAADPTCAMAWWGVALANGPNINVTKLSPKSAKTAWDAIHKAEELASGASPLEKALINALSKRYAEQEPPDRSALNEAYAAAMRELWIAYPRNAEVGSLYAESLLDLHPWDLWKTDGTPQPWTPEITATIARVMAIDVEHPGANHYWIHALEGSPHAERAMNSANRLRTLAPGAAHLVHMSAHIYVHTARWNDASQSNINAMKVNAAYYAVFPPPFYLLGFSHYPHFQVFTATMRGRYEEAISNARKMVSSIPKDFFNENAPIADGLVSLPFEVLMRFGKWDEILAEPEPQANLPLSRALLHYVRAAALNSLDRSSEAQQERIAFREAAAAVPSNWEMGNNSAADILAINSLVLDGEFSARAGQYDEAVAKLREGVRLEDNLKYDEPPIYIQPVRHALGAVLLRADRPRDAEYVYREDLVRHPENGWALFGLAKSLDKQRKYGKAREVWTRFRKVWADADTKLDASCFCQATL